MKMNSWRFLYSTIIILGILILSLTVCAQSEYIDIEWMELMPADDLEVLLNPAEFIFDIEARAANDNMNVLQEISPTDTTKRFQQALELTRVVETFYGKIIRLVGFVVAL